MRRITATIAATVIAGSALIAPAAQAQGLGALGTLGQMTKLLNGGIADMDCNTLGTTLRATKLVDAETTRSGLVANLNNAVGTDPALKLFAGSTVKTVADKALACGVVKPDPVTPTTKFLELSSNLSSNSDLATLATIAALSSK